MKKVIILLIIGLMGVVNLLSASEEIYLNERNNNVAGGFQSNTTYTLLSSVGETVIGSMDNDVHTLISGFLQAISVFDATDIKAKLPADRIAWAVNNKFNPAKGEKTIIQFRVGDTRKRITIKIYNLFGEFVKTVIDQEYDPKYSNTGNPLDDFWSVTWSGININNLTVGSGIYLIVIKVGNEQKILKAAVVK